MVFCTMAWGPVQGKLEDFGPGGWVAVVWGPFPGGWRGGRWVWGGRGGVVLPGSPGAEGLLFPFWGGGKP